MIKVKFRNSETMYEVSYRNISDHVCELLGDAPKNLSGFDTFRLDGTPLGDRSEFITCYREVVGGYQYSNDGSVWVEPPVPEPMPDPEPVDPVPTQLDRVEAQALYTAMMTDTLLEE